MLICILAYSLGFHASVALNPLVLLLVARGGRKQADRQADRQEDRRTDRQEDRRTDRPSTVTLAVQARRGLTSSYIIQSPLLSTSYCFLLGNPLEGPTYVGVKRKILPLCLKGRCYTIIAFRPKGKILRHTPHICT